MIDCFIALGSNLGKRKNNIKTAIAMLEESSEITIVSESGIYESKPMYNSNLKDKVSETVNKVSLEEINNQSGKKEDKLQVEEN